MLVERIMRSVISRALYTSSLESLQLSLTLKLTNCSLLGDSGGKMPSSFKLNGSPLLLGTLSTPFSVFKLTGFKTSSLSVQMQSAHSPCPSYQLVLGTGHKVQEGVGWKKSGGGPSFLCTKKKGGSRNIMQYIGGGL